MSKTVPNLIKQPAQCCVHCGKSYKKKSNLEKHASLCELLHTSKKKGGVLENEEEDIPSQRKLYHILLELGVKFNALEEKVNELNKWVVKKKKKINMIEWLNANIVPEITFDQLIDKIHMDQQDVRYLFNNPFVDTLNHIFARTIYNTTESEYPIFAFVQKPNVFYVYENEDVKWTELSREKLIKFLNRVHMKLFRIYADYKKENADKINADESFSLLCDKTSVKIMNTDFRQESLLSKIRSNMYGQMKTDMKALVEYEFEF